MQLISIKSKLIALTRRALVLSLGFLLFAIIVTSILKSHWGLKYMTRNFRENLIKSGNFLVLNISVGLRGMVVDNAFTSVRELVSGVLEWDDNLVYGIYMDDQRRPWVYADSGNPSGHLSEAIILNDSISQWAHGITKLQHRELLRDGRRVIEFAAPVSVENLRLGTIRYGIATTVLDKAVSKIRRFVLIITVVSLLAILAVGIVLFSFISRKVHAQASAITDPLFELAESAVAISKHQYDKPVAVKTDDEIGILAKNLENMRVTIKKYTGNLQDMVDEKTRKLDDAMRDLQRSNRELEQFAYVASHDLQEPLRMVSSYLQLITKRYKEKLDKSGHEFIDFAVDGAFRMQQLISDLLTYSRVGTKVKPFKKTDGNGVFEKAVKNLEISIVEHKAKVTCDPLPELLGDEGQLVQLFQNIIGNALKFCKGRIPEVHVSVNKEESKHIFNIRDNGIGIAAENQKRIFQIFQRLHGREEYEGTGIGLAVCNKIVERHGGKIWVESEVGKGTAFLFTITNGNNE